MTGFAVGKTLNYGYPGTVSRSSSTVIENRFVKSTDTNPIPFGSAVILNSDNSYSAMGAGATASQFAGIAVREVKTNLTYGTNASGSYQPGQPCDVLMRGSATIQVNNGTPTANGTVYVRIAANASIPAGVVGGFEAAADGTNTVALTNVKFKTGLLDANNVAEVTILTQQMA